MARSQMRHNVRDAAGNVIQNALCYVYLTGTTTAVSDMYAAASGGAAITTLTSDAQGDVEAWFDTAKTVDVKVTDNSNGAFYPSLPTKLLDWVDFTETVQIAGSATASSASAVSFTPVGTIAATDVQAAVAEVATDAASDSALKAPLASPTFTGVATAPVFKASGLTGAVAASRYVGATASGAPASGTFAIGDFIIDQTAKVWVCTVAGSPGTWVSASGASAPPISGALALATTDAWNTKVTGDAQDRFVMDADGNLQWGTGAAVSDVRLERHQPGQLYLSQTGGSSNTLTLDANGAVVASQPGAAYIALNLDGLTVNMKSSGSTVGSWGSGGLTITDAKNIALGTTTGTKIGTATSQKLGFYNATPIAQQTGVAVTAAGVHAALVALGLITA